MKKLVTMLTLSIFLAWQGIGQAATTVDALIQKLIEKGILTEQEATQIKGEIAYEQKTAEENQYKRLTPDWVQNTKLTGDFRVRNQLQHRRTENPAENTQDLGRIRARLGFETKMNDEFKMAIGIATSGSGVGSANNSSRSNNQTFDQTFGKGPVVLNYAYGQWTPDKEWTLTGGQMKNPIWEPMEFLWDGDITPTGGAVEYNHKLNDDMAFLATGGVFVVKTLTTSNSDTWMYVGQGGIKSKLLGEKADIKILGGYQGLQNKTNVALDGTTSTNTLSGGKYVYHYNQPTVAAELGLNDPFSDNSFIYVPRIAVFGEYTMNPHPTDEATAWMGGVYIGNSKVASKGAWKATWAYKVIGRDAWPDVLPDSDFWSGATDVKGMEGIFEYGLSKNVTFVADLYMTARKTESPSASAPGRQREYLLQTDINWKF